MTTINPLNKKGKYLTKLLRHRPEELNLDKNGWVDISEVLVKLKITNEDLENIVKDDNKSRFTFNDDKTKIRASQGHSIDIDLELEEKIPPFPLYHGTSKAKEQIIFDTGLKKMRRHHVHLSSDIVTAATVGRRHKGQNAIIFYIDTKSMVKHGIKFYISKNGVWLTDYVNPIYLYQPKDHEKINS